MDAKHRVESVGDYVQVLRKSAVGEFEGPLWFRGHQEASYRLQASALRKPNFAKNEVALLKRFMQDARPRLDVTPVGTWDWLLLAQHHGVPTRLLDWSENALVGLFFACEAGEKNLEGVPKSDGTVWVLMPETLNTLSGTWNAHHSEDLPFLEVNRELNRYNPMAPPEQTPLKHIAVIAARNFPRIISQWGTFTLTGEPVPMEDLAGAEKFLTRIDVAGESKTEIIKELRSLGIEERTIYPDLHRLGSRVREMFS